MRRVLDAAARGEATKAELIQSEQWRSPIVVDIIGGTIVFAVGLYLSIAWSPISGGAIGAAGAVYVLLAVRRWRHWRAQRDEQPRAT